MIDFDEIRRKLQTIDSFIGSELYVQYKHDPKFNVFNKYDPESNVLIKPQCRKLVLYGTDTPFTEQFLPLLNAYEKIYSVNNTVLGNPRIVSLPLGLVDTADTISYITCYKKRNFSLFDLLKECRDKHHNKPSKILYMNYRVPPDLKVRTDSLAVKSGVPCEMVTDETFFGQDWLLFQDTETYQEYFSRCLDHMFIACPEGFGIDSYRFYETLYLGRIPVVLHNPVTDMFRDLPILFLDKWDDFEKEYGDFVDRFNIENYDFSRLSPDYWKSVLES